MKDKRENDMQYEKMRDNAERFVAERYDSGGFYMHFHRNPELYCVCKGHVFVTINGESRLLKDGEMALISGLENHSYEVEHSADIAYFHIGTKYTEPFRKLYNGKSPSHWLTDAKYNMTQLMPLVETVMQGGREMTELEKVSIANLLLARVVKKYGVNEKRTYFVGGGKISEIIQYIYDNSDTELSLGILAEKFGYVPQVLSRKISACLDMDIRVFINDVRAQKVMMLRDQEEYKGLSLMEIAGRCGFNSVATFYRSYNRNFRYSDISDIKKGNKNDIVAGVKLKPTKPAAIPKSPKQRTHLES